MDSKLNLKLDYLPGLGYLLFHSHIPVIRKIEVTNNSDEVLEGLILFLNSSDEFSVPKQIKIDTILPRETFEINDLKIKIQGKFFAYLTERMRGAWEITIQKNDQILVKQDFDLDLLAFDQWLGSSLMPELVTGFVLPNIPELTPLVKKAAEFLKTWSGSSAFDEYQSKNPNRVKTQIGAIYAAIKALNIVRIGESFL